MSNIKLTEIISKKVRGESLSEEDIAYFVNSVVLTTKKDANPFQSADRCQIGAMLMAIYLKGFNKFETAELTREMKCSGTCFVWPEEWKPLMVDKHSTGGVGDKVSLILAPALAALNLKVPMISGRSLSHTGGTLDKLESIPGFRVDLRKEEILTAMGTVGCCIVGQTKDCVPADKVLYHCRELTSTVDFSPFIIASIASKKLSEELNSLVYDVKYGKGSIFKSKEEALETAKSLVEASKSINVSAILTSMESPLGRSIGNSLEVLEAIECLQGGGPDDVIKIVCALGAELLYLTRKICRHEGEILISMTLQNGQAMKKFFEMIMFQGVSQEIASELCYGDSVKVFETANNYTDVTFTGRGGYISEIDPLGLARLCKEEIYFSRNNPNVGFKLLKTVGDEIHEGEAWLRFHHQRKELSEYQLQKLSSIIAVAYKKVERKLIDKCIYYKNESLTVEDY